MMSSHAVVLPRSAYARVGRLLPRSVDVLLSPQAVLGTLERRLIWVLIVSLAVYALSGGILRTAGPKHWHAASTALPAAANAPGLLSPVVQQAQKWLGQVQALADAAHARAHALGVAPHQHSHSAVLRHWHDPADDTVRLLADEAVSPELADLKAAAALGGATLTLALATLDGWRLAKGPNGRWPQAKVPRWGSALTPPPIDPPIA